MANNYTKILDLANKNNMGLSNTIKRDYGIPLDYSSVQENYDAAVKYAATSTLAYVGQPISVGDTLYIISDTKLGTHSVTEGEVTTEYDVYLKAVGTKTEGDDASVFVNDDGTVSLYGFVAAADVTLPRKSVDGKLEWVPITSMLPPEQNEKTRIVKAEGSDLTIESTYDSDSDTYTYTLGVTLPDVPEYSIIKTPGNGQTTYSLTKDNVETGESIIVPDAYDDSVLRSEVSGFVETITGYNNRLTAVEAFFDGATKDSAGLNDALDKLVDIQQYLSGDGAEAGGLLGTVSANAEAIATLTGEGEGSVKKAVSDAVGAHAAEAATTYALAADLAEVRDTANNAAVKTVVDEALATKVTKTELETNYYNKDQVYTKEAIDNALAGIKGEYGETADSVYGDLQTHITENSEKFALIDTKDEAQDSLIQANADEIAAIKNGTTGILAVAKSYADNQVKALAEGAVSTNASDIAELNNKLNSNLETITNNISGLNTRAGALEQADINLGTRIDTLEGKHNSLSDVVSGHTSAIGTLQTAVDTAKATISEHTAKFANYSTTEQMNSAIATAVGAIDNTAIQNGIANNTSAIEAEVSRADAEEKRLAGLISTNAAELSRIDNVLKAAIENTDDEPLNSIKELAAWISDHADGTDGVLTAIEANTTAIATLNGTGDGSVKKTVDDAIAAIPVANGTTAGLVKASDEITVAEDGTLGIGFISVNRIIQNTGDTLVLNGGSAGVQEA